MRGRHTHDMGLRSTVQSTHRQMPPQQGHSQSDRVYQVGDTWEKKKYLWIQQKVEEGTFQVNTVPGKLNTATEDSQLLDWAENKKNEEKTGKYDGNQRGVGNAVEELGGYF